ncbi:MAG: zinc-dependent alcohol dehydrogenase family protein [Deltaproteobacteria bacterium]|nr:zinc-dependent alcohol dehydrogenase family protein [Deltaproteobacteria bacterium]MCL5276488.1 zinc-dependent alcohol dehydrogenase family protein [Deltaproteobacteria bacterium]
MKAMVITAFGGPEVFEERDIPKPEPGIGQVLVKVHATSVNPIDYMVRRAGAWAGIRPPAVIGYDVSGVVEAVGSGVRSFKPGNEVYYTSEISAQGTYAEYHVAEEKIVAHKPSNLTHIEAASVPLAGSTAFEALVARADLRMGESVLIHAGAGGVGSIAIQLARALGASVFATCGVYNMELVKHLGADRVIDYRENDFADVVLRETGMSGVDVVLDTVGGETLSKSVKAAKRFGRIVSIAASKSDLSAAQGKNITIHFMSMQRDRLKLDALRALIERGRVRPVIDSVMPLKDVALAHRRLEKGGVKGKIVLQVV